MTFLENIFWVMIRTGLCYCVENDFYHTMDWFQKSLRRGEKRSDQVKTAWSLINMAGLELFRGDYEKAQDHLNRTMDLFQKINLHNGIICTDLFQGWIAVIHGDLEKALMLITLISLFYYEGEIDKAGDLVTFFSKERINTLTGQFPFFCRIHKDVLEPVGYTKKTLQSG